ncbi:MAG: type II toxin-antitoxin system Phd/YefM family antitoxin [Deltaproteobacteria bacterium]|nr:type II toxin-antitoxin system Phd/YefM family antitoxin [Deltaproteobacteria bacterium]
MKFVTVRDLRLKPRELWEKLKAEHEVVLTSNGRPVAILAGVDEDTFEDTVSALRRLRAMRALDRIHRHSIARGLDRVSQARIEAEIRAARAERRR